MKINIKDQIQEIVIKKNHIEFSNTLPTQTLHKEFSVVRKSQIFNISCKVALFEDNGVDVKEYRIDIGDGVTRYKNTVIYFKKNDLERCLELYDKLLKWYIKE